MVLPLLMHCFETEATKAIGESIWPLASSCLYSGRRKRWSWESAGIVQSCNRYTKLTIQPYLPTLMSNLSSRENNENANTYLEWLKIGDAHFPGKTCYTFLTRLRESENRPFFSFTRVIFVSTMKNLRDWAWSCHNDCHKKSRFRHNCDKQ